MSQPRDETKRPGLMRRLASALTRPLRLRPSRGAKAGDFLLAVAGAALGVTCAVFPWYIFMHQDEFGIRALKFEGGVTSTAAPAGMAPSTAALVNPAPVPDDAALSIDLFATGTLPDPDDGPRSPPGLGEQPFPATPVNFRLVHVANGRAMIEDDGGLWIVQRGSTLPDNSRVTSIEQREGRWVMVTTGDRLVEITP
jgi:hypothetical protein